MYIANCCFLLAYGAGRLSDLCDVAGCTHSKDLFIHLCILHRLYFKIGKLCLTNLRYGGKVDRMVLANNFGRHLFFS